MEAVGMEVPENPPTITEAAIDHYGAGYASLASVLARALNQAAAGRGRERHANDLPFHRQRMMTLIDLHGYGFAAGQAGKKVAEGLEMENPERCKQEILGAINYLAGIIVHMDHRSSDEEGHRVF